MGKVQNTMACIDCQNSCACLIDLLDDVSVALTCTCLSLLCATIVLLAVMLVHVEAGMGFFGRWQIGDILGACLCINCFRLFSRGFGLLVMWHALPLA